MGRPRVRVHRESGRQVPNRGPGRGRYPMGERVAIDAATAACLERGPLAEQFVFLRDRSRG
jgi:hypothetical protein